jgi:exodeoxyribonuclease VII small subunit
LEMKMKDFESNLKSLEEIVSKLESGDLALDKALELFEEGVKISRYCNAKLEEAERKVATLIKGADGSMAEVPFAAEGEDATK